MKPLLLIKSFALFLLILFSGYAKATDYYVSSSGNDANNGTSTSTPWKTLSKVQSVCNNRTIVAGDKILFKKGDMFTGTLLVSNIWGYTANSGTATNPITFSTYGTGNKPIFQYPTGGTTAAENRILMRFVGVKYYVIDGFNFTDLVYPTNDKKTPANCGVPLYIGASGEASTDYFTIQNVDISLCGMGIVLVGSNNKVIGCSLTNFKNLKSTPNTGGSTAYEDYGANALTLINGNDNEITGNYISGAWAESLDFGWNGGACEIFNSCNRNKMMYNTIYDCGGVAEFGADMSGAVAADNLFAYNKIINCGSLSWSNISGVFAINVANVQYFNNVIVENNASRFSGPNTGSGITTPSALALIYPEKNLFAYNGTPVAQYVYNVKNNAIHLSTGIMLARTNDPKTFHANNAYNLSNGSIVNSTLGASEIVSSSSLFTNTSSFDPIGWDFYPSTNSALIDRGQNLGFTKDFAGNPVPSIPNSGIFENVVTTATLTASATSGTISCNGGSTSLVVSASGGTAPYTGTGTFTVTAGTYSYTVKDANGITASTSVTVAQPTSIALTVTSGNILSFGGTTTITANATGGTGVYSYQLNSGTYQSSNIFSNVAAGTYTVSVKDANSCIKSNTITITQPGAALTASATSGTISCNGGSTSVVVSASGGTAPYTGIGTFTVTAGTYSYTVKDANGITASTSITVTQPTAITLTVTSGSILSFGGTTTITATASGGTGVFSYQLNTGTYQSSNIFSNVAAGTYTVNVKDANGCIKSNSITVTQPGAALTASATSGTINCNGGSTNVVVSASGGIAPYTGTGTFTVTAGTYSYTVKDANGITASTSITIAQPTAIALTVTSGNILSFGGTTSITANATGGTGVFSYQLNSGTYQSSNIFSNVAAGNYTVNVKDANGCIKSNTITVTQPSTTLTATAISGNIACNGGSTNVVVSASGGTAPYTGTGTFTVTAGTYSYTVKDANGITASTSITVAQPTAIALTVTSGNILSFGGTTTITANASGGTGLYSYQLNSGTYQSSNIFSNVAAGTYTVNVKDANGCIISNTITVTQPGAALTASVTSGTISCNGGSTSVVVSASGGTAPYTGTGTFTVTAGTYSYTVKDANGITASTSITVAQPTALLLNVTVAGDVMAGETTSINVTATGGTGSYLYSLNSGSFQTSSSFSGLTAGNYTMTVKDKNNCSASATFTVNQLAVAPLKFSSVFVSNVSCKRGNDGQIIVNAAGGATPYYYSINSSNNYSTSNTFRNLKAGNYSVFVKDANNNIIDTVVVVRDGNRPCNKNIKTTNFRTTTFPNPTINEFSLKIESESDDKITVDVFNMMGNRVYQYQGKINGVLKFGNDFKKGMYFIKIRQGSNCSTEKIIKL